MSQRHLRPYQRTAVDQAALTHDTRARATVVLPCGTGKTLVAAHLTADQPRVAVFAPTIALVEQLADDFTAAAPDRPMILVCSPAPAHPARPAAPGGPATPQVTDTDDIPASDLTPQRPGDLVTTDLDTLTTALRATPDVLLVSTYASAATVAAATTAAGITWDSVVADEAHRTAGLADKAWALALNDDALPARRRLFTTATPRQFATDPDSIDTDGEPLQVASMTDPALYGPLIQPLTLRQAITDGWLSDYRIAVVAVPDTHAQNLVSRTGLTPTGELLDLRAAAAQIALARYAATHPDLNAVIAFHNRISDSQAWTNTWHGAMDALDPGQRPSGGSTVTHLDGSMPRDHRTHALNALRNPTRGRLTVVSNCRVLSEGVDVPALDAVLLAAPRTSGPDIVQIIGRALRPHPSAPGRKALVIIPVVVPDDTDPTAIETAAVTRGYLPAWQVLTTMATEDEALFTTLARRRAAIDTGTPTPDAEEDGQDMLDLDLELLPPETAARFTLRLIRSTTSTWATLAAHAQAHVAAGHTLTPPAAYRTRDGYPLGQRLRAARTAYRAKRLHPHVIRLLEAVPGWTWTGTGRAARTFDGWLTLLDAHLERTGATTVLPFEKTTTPDGTLAPLGRWVHDRAATPHTLTPAQRTELNRRLPGLLHP